MSVQEDRIDPDEFMDALRTVVLHAPKAEFIVRRYKRMVLSARRGDTVGLRSVRELGDLASSIRNIEARCRAMLADVTLWGVLSDYIARMELDSESGEHTRQQSGNVDHGRTPPAA